MADVWITVKIMPESIEVDIKGIEAEARRVIERLGGRIKETAVEPVAFGLNCIKIILLLSEDRGTEELERSLSGIEGASSASIVEMTRSII